MPSLTFSKKNQNRYQALVCFRVSGSLASGMLWLNLYTIKSYMTMEELLKSKHSIKKILTLTSSTPIW